MDYDINRPWLTLDQWQEEYITTPPEIDCFLLTTRQAGKTTAMSIKSVNLCVQNFGKGDCILISSITEKQAFHMLAKALAYAKEVYPKETILKGKDKPTKHRMNFKSGASILCYAAGESGEGLRGFTIKKHMVDEGSRMSEEFFVATGPALSVCQGSQDIASTPCGKEGYFYEASKDKTFKKFYVSAENCPRHSKEFLEKAKSRMTSLQYAQEYLAQFLDEFKRVFTKEWIKQVCIAGRREEIVKGKEYYIGVDVAGWGDDKCTYEVFEKIGNDKVQQVENIVEMHNLTTETTRKIIELDDAYEFQEIGVDDGGPGFGVFSELMTEDQTKRKTIALNNASRPTTEDGKRTKKILKEEMYINLQVMGEHGRLILLDDDEIQAALRGIQQETVVEPGKRSKTVIHGKDDHIVEGITRGVWLAKEKELNIEIHSIKV